MSLLGCRGMNVVLFSHHIPRIHAPRRPIWVEIAVLQYFKSFYIKNPILVVKYRYQAHCSASPPSARVGWAFNGASLAPGSLTEVSKAFACPKLSYFKSFYIQNPSFSGKPPVPVLSNPLLLLLARRKFATRYQYVYITLFRRKNEKKEKKVSARPVTTAILLLRYLEGQPYYAYARNLHHRHRFDKESPVFAIYTQQLTTTLKVRIPAPGG
jgi:hypothetical protein